MPELPEVETIVRELRPVLEGKTVGSVEVLWQRSIIGDYKEFISGIVGRVIVEVTRRGKYICWLLDDGCYLTIHLRMTGRLVYCPGEDDQKHLRVCFIFLPSPGEEEGCRLYFIDPRKFGKIKLWGKGQPLLSGLGPEPLAAAVVRQALKSVTSSRAIKTVLLDQGVLAGVGNIYADEVLFAARVHPLTPAVRLSSHKRARLSRLLPEILEAATGNQGTTLSDYRRPGSGSGSNQYYLKVYGQEGQPCPRCAALIRRIVINGRSSHFCPACQKAASKKRSRSSEQ